jgi:PIN domain nuclease of toxin-antitoxin system
MIERGADAVFVSAASIWEIEIKRALHKLEAPDRPDACPFSTATLSTACSSLRRVWRA